MAYRFLLRDLYLYNQIVGTEPQREVWSCTTGIQHCYVEYTHACRLQASLTRSARGIRTGFLRFACESAPRSESSSPRRPRNRVIPTRACKIRIKNQSPEGLTSGLSGAATRIRTGDLILTKDVLYQLSHSSKVTKIFPYDSFIITNISLFVNTFSKNISKCFFTLST